MSDKKTLTPAIAVIGTALAGGLGQIQLANAAENPFLVTPLEAGYVLLAGSDAEGKCGGAGGDKGTEGKCGEGKCGEGKCGNAT